MMDQQSQTGGKSAVIFHLGGDLILAPMDGITDSPFRKLSRSYGSAISYSEFINAIDVVNKHPKIDDRLFFQESERPFAYQLLDNHPERMTQAARRLLEYQPDFLDINLGCSARSVSNRGAGSGLLKEPLMVQAIVSSLVKEIDLPITAKIRLGWDDKSRNYLEIAKVIEDSGCAMIAVHARTRQQAYSGNADWDAIAEIKQVLKIPVIGNGDVRTTDDIYRMKTHTRCDAVMIGRGAFGNPWIFSNRDRWDIVPIEVYNTICDHLREMIQCYGEERGLILFRKHIVKYLSPYPVFNDYRRRMVTCDQAGELLDLSRRVLLIDKS